MKSLLLSGGGYTSQMLYLYGFLILLLVGLFAGRVLYKRMRKTHTE